jgi:F0F1-type ATP synthase membrane subunit c/vacuolar-type H+-ATPase subunit K
MLDQSIQENLDKIHNNIRIIWIAIMASLGVMLIVAHAAGDQVGQNPEAMTMLRYPLMLAAVLILLAVPMIRRFLLKAGAQAAKATDNPSEKFSILAARYSSAVIATLALCESVTIFGLVLYFLGGDMPTFYIFLAASIVGMYAYRPRREALEDLVKIASGQMPY